MLVLALATLGGCTNSDSNSQAIETASAESFSADVSQILENARRIPTTSRWFEVLALPNDIYALWEPGHGDYVNSFLIAGETKHVLYDTGLGFVSIKAAVQEIIAAENLPDLPIMVINSHNHLDHNGGNIEFDNAWIIEDEWGIEKLTQGLSGFAGYWQQRTDHPGVKWPENVDPETFSLPRFPRERIRFLADGDTVDLGNRRFQVIHTTAHSPDGLALYDPSTQIFFGGDTFVGDRFLVRSLDMLADDLERLSTLPVAWHYSSHGPQLLATMQAGRQLVAVRRMLEGEGSVSTTTFAGLEFPLRELEGVSVTLASDFLLY